MSKIELLCEQLGLTEHMLELVVKGEATLEYKHCCFLRPKNAITTGVVMNDKVVYEKTTIKPDEPNVAEIAMKAHETEVEQESKVEPENTAPDGFSSNLFEASADGIIDPVNTGELPPWPEPETNFNSTGVTLPSVGSESAVATTPKRTEDPDWMKSNWE